MAENPGKWPSKRGAISKIMPSDGCKGDTAPLALGLWYDFHEFGWHLGNVGIYGWSSPKQAALYTRAADRKRLANDAMAMVDPDYSENESVPPESAVEASGTMKGKKAC